MTASGFSRDKDGRLVITTGEGKTLSEQSGFLRDQSGSLVVVGAEGGPVDAGLSKEVEVMNLGSDWSDGDDIPQFSSVTPVHRLEIKEGTAAAPVTKMGPTVKINRTEAITEAEMESFTSPGGDGADSVAGLQVMVKGTAASETQTVAGYFSATNSSNHESKAANPQPDAAAIYAMGRITGGTSPNATGIGAVVVGRRDSGVVGDVSGMELHSHNRAAAGTYASVGHSDTTGLWLTAAGTADSGCGISIGNPESIKFKVGIGIPNQNNGGVAESSFRDDGKAKRSIDIRGEHSEAAMTVASGAGSIVIGAQAFTATTTQLLELNGGATNRNPILKIASEANTTHTILFNNTSANFTVGQSGSASSLITGTVAGDGVLMYGNTSALHIGRSAVRGTMRLTENVGIGQGAADSMGGGKGVVFLANAGTVPTTNPTGGGILYCEAGKLMYRGSSGTVKELAAA